MKVIRMVLAVAVLAAWLWRAAPAKSRQVEQRSSRRRLRLPSRRLSLPAPAGASQPQLTSSSRGTILSWVEQNGATATLRFAQRTGTEWSAARTVASGSDWFLSDADVPTVQRLADGTLVAAWYRSTNVQQEAYDAWLAYSKDDGKAWSRPFKPYKDRTKTQHGFVSMFDQPGGGLGPGLARRARMGIEPGRTRRRRRDAALGRRSMRRGNRHPIRSPTCASATAARRALRPRPMASSPRSAIAPTRKSATSTSPGSTTASGRTRSRCITTTGRSIRARSTARQSAPAVGRSRSPGLRRRPAKGTRMPRSRQTPVARGANRSGWTNRRPPGASTSRCWTTAQPWRAGWNSRISRRSSRRGGSARRAPASAPIADSGRGAGALAAFRG